MSDEKKVKVFKPKNEKNINIYKDIITYLQRNFHCIYFKNNRCFKYLNENFEVKGTYVNSTNDLCIDIKWRQDYICTLILFNKNEGIFEMGHRKGNRDEKEITFKRPLYVLKKTLKVIKNEVTDF